MQKLIDFGILRVITNLCKRNGLPNKLEIRLFHLQKKYFSSKDNLEVLDYGAGKGHLTSLLLLENISVSACDFSNENIINLNSKFSSYSNFNDGILIRKFPTLFESNLFDFVFLIEAIEHLTDDYLESTIKEIMRILKPNGKIMITTPK